MKMKRKIIKQLPVLILFTLIMSGCISVWDETWIEHIPGTIVEIDTVFIPPWDEQIITDQINTGKE